MKERTKIGLLIGLILMLLCACLTSWGQTKDQVYGYLVTTSIKHRQIVLKQSQLESGHYTSYLCRVNHNLFGMKLAKNRPTTAIGENKGYAVYSSWRDCIDDYEIYQLKYYKSGDYYDFLSKSGYAESKNYINKLKRIL